jgi:hypothetical protein
VTDDELNGIFRKAASAALSWWYTDQWDSQQNLLDDLVQDLWVWYRESPATQKKLAESDGFLARRLVYIAAIQTLHKDAVEDDIFHGRSKYSADCVREALRGESTNEYLNEILPTALDNLANRNVGQAEAIKRRYDHGDVSNLPSEKMLLSRAVKSVTEEVNFTHITSDTEGVGSRTVVFPETRKPKGGYSDPTGNTVVLLDENPEYRYHFYQETPMHQLLGGAAAQPAFGLGTINGLTVRYRRSG